MHAVRPGIAYALSWFRARFIDESGRLSVAEEDGKSGGVSALCIC